VSPSGSLASAVTVEFWPTCTVQGSQRAFTVGARLAGGGGGGGGGAGGGAARSTAHRGDTQRTWMPMRCLVFVALTTALTLSPSEPGRRRSLGAGTGRGTHRRRSTSNDDAGPPASGFREGDRCRSRIPLAEHLQLPRSPPKRNRSRPLNCSRQAAAEGKAQPATSTLLLILAEDAVQEIGLPVPSPSPKLGGASPPPTANAGRFVACERR
jgi:hypothetical protein